VIDGQLMRLNERVVPDSGKSRRSRHRHDSQRGGQRATQRGSRTKRHDGLLEEKQRIGLMGMLVFAPWKKYHFQIDESFLF
jgi:hypothetical protein